MTRDAGGERPFIPFPESPLLPPETEAERWLYGLTRFGMKPGLHNIRALVERFGYPERELRFLHVAGSNGKGSTCHILDSLLRAAGYRTGLFTSPHLLRVGERLRVGGLSLTEERLETLLGLVEAPVSELQATFFETMTLLALLHFREQKVDWVLWETGLGGRLDCTRVARAEACLLTSISRDHTRYLGESLEEIALEKLAIGLPGRPYYCALEEGPLLDLVRAESRRIGFELRELRALLPWRLAGDELLLDALPGLPAGRFALPGLPAAQASNAALALLTLAELGERRGEKLLPEDPGAALAATPLPARFHRLRQRPPLVLDGAHNPAALAETLRAWDSLLDLEVRAGDTGAAGNLRPSDAGKAPAGDAEGVIIFACMEDKESDEMLQLLAGRPRRVVFTAVRQGRALPAEQFLDHPLAAGRSWQTAANLHEAFRLAGEKSPILVTGSFYLAAEAYQLLQIDPWQAFD